MLVWLKWFGSGTGVTGALLVALNLPISGWGFVVFLVSSAAWLTAAVMQRDTALAVLCAVYMGVDVLGIYRWLIA